MKKAMLLIIFALAFTTACGKAETSRNSDSAILQTYYQALEEISYDSELIVEAELIGNQKESSYQNARFTVTEFIVKKVYKGDQELVSSAIQVLEIFPFRIKESKNKLLFLEKYVGPVTNSAYVVTGVYQGKFTIGKNNKLIYEAGKRGDWI